MQKKVFVGIDTSNYTTSLAIVGENGELIANLKRPLTVSSGERGLRQSDALFAHIKNLPSLMGEAREYLGEAAVAAVGVSEKPRRVEGSYMPCFLAGVAAAESFSAALNLPLYRFSHQCGHIMAALYSSGADKCIVGDFAAFHISGGTTELLRVSATDDGFSAECVGGTRDLNAGQVIDRVGVYLGLPFPAGPHLEALASDFKGKPEKKRVSVSGTYANLSGLENLAINLYNRCGEPSGVAAFIFDYLGNAVLEMCRGYINEYGDVPFVFAGGVMCNGIIKSKLKDGLARVYFAQPSMSADNAVGIAVLTMKRHGSRA